MRQGLVHIIIVFLILVGLIFLNAAGALPPFLDVSRRGMEFLSRPTAAPLQVLKNFAAGLVSLRDIMRQNQILGRQVEELSVQIAELEKSDFENRVLREALNFKADTPLVLIPAEVITLDVLNIDQKVTINRGRDQGIEAGDAVVVSGSVLVGAVSEVFDSTSQFELITSSAVAVNAQVAKSGASGIVRGEHGLGLLFDLISQTDTIEARDRIITSGLGGRFPANLLIGFVSEIRSSSSELFQKASLIPATNLRNLRVVFVVKKSQ